jgi:succinate dehydrogenase / fumarate reductase, cytochrome b subunit
MTKKNMPLSPHLTIYKPQITSILSISHRISGVINFFGMLIILWWIVYISFSTNDLTKNYMWKFFSTNLGIYVLIAWSFSLFLHMCTGIRHLFWDAGIGFSLKAVNLSGWSAVIASLILTASTWYIIFEIIE